MYDEAIASSKEKETHKIVEAQVIRVSSSFMYCSPILFFCSKFCSLTLNLGFSHNFAFAWVETWVLDVDLDIEVHAPCIFEHLTFFLSWLADFVVLCVCAIGVRYGGLVNS